MAAEQSTSFRSLTLMLRGRAKLTQRQLGASIDVSERTVQMWEAGLSFPSAAALQRLIGVYLARAAFSAGRELEEASAFWEAARTGAPRLKTPFDHEWFASLLAATAHPPSSQPPPPPLAAPEQPAHTNDWGEAPSVSVFHGRVTEQHQVADWLLNQDASVVGLLGMGGIGKTALAARVAHDLAPRFDAVFWRSLRIAPPCADWLADAILSLSEQTLVPAHAEEARLRQLLQLLRERRCLLVLDNLETVLEPQLPVSAYRDCYTSYGVLLRSLGETAHRGALIVTSREEPPELARLEGPSGSVRILRLSGLDDEAACALLADRGLVGSPDTWGALVQTYYGNALALQVVGELIGRLFGGDIEAFLHAGEPVFGDIRRLLDEQISRLGVTARAVLYWLAIERDPVDFNTLAADLGSGVARHDILDALVTLDRRSLLESGGADATFTLQPVVLEHATEQIIATSVAELDAAEPVLLVTHALVKVETKEYIRRTGERMIARPLLDRLAAHRSPEVIDDLLMSMLDRWRGRPRNEQGFGPGNVLNLLRLHRGQLRGLDLSGLLLRQTDLSSVELQDASLVGARLEEVLLARQSGAAVSARLSPDGTRLAVGTDAGEVRVWRIADLGPELVDSQPLGGASDVAISADGQLVASCGGHAGLWLWKAGAAMPPRMLALDSHALYMVALSADGSIVAAAGPDGHCRVWDARTSECLASINHHSTGARGLALSADGRTLAIGSFGNIAVWKLDGDSRYLGERRFSGVAATVALSADGRLVANGDGDGTVHVWEALTGKSVAALHGHEGTVWAIAINACGDAVASGGADCTVRVWNVRTGQCQRVFHEHAAGVFQTSLSADGRYVSSVGMDGCGHVWDVRRGNCLVSLRGSVPAVHDVALSADNRLALTGGGDGNVRLWDLETGGCARVLRGHDSAVWAVAISPTGDVAVSGDLSRSIRVWDLNTGECRTTLSGHVQSISGVALSPDRRLIASCSFDGTLRLWDPERGDCLMVLPCSAAGVRMLRFAADGNLLISGDLDGAVRIWDVQSGTCLKVLQHDGSQVRALAPSADGRRLVTAAMGSRLQVWDTTSGECVHVVQTEAGDISAIALSANGEKLVCGAVDGTIQVWDLATRELRSVHHGHSAEVWGVALDVDGRFAVSGGLDGTVRLWDLGNGGVELRTMRPDRPYERMNITGLAGVNDIQRNALLALGAVER